MSICWKMTRIKTNLLYARTYKNRPKRKETSILSSEQEMKVAFMVVSETNQQSSQWKSYPPALEEGWGRWVRLHEHAVCFLEQWGSSSEGIFSSVPVCESTLLHQSIKGFYGSCWEKMPNKWLTQDWFLHHDNMPWHTDFQLFLLPGQKMMVVVSDVCTSPS